MQGRKIACAILKALTIWGFATWVYVVCSVLDPSTASYQGGPMSVYVPFDVNAVGVFAFVVSFFAFIGYEALKD